MWLLVAPRAAKVLMVMRASVSSRLILASAPQNGAVRGSQPEATARKSGRRLTRNLNCPPSPGSRDRVYTADQNSNTVSVIDPASNTLLGQIRLGNPRPDIL